MADKSTLRMNISDKLDHFVEPIRISIISNLLKCTVDSFLNNKLSFNHFIFGHTFEHV